MHSGRKSQEAARFRAVIEAMRDPTPSMIDVGDREIYMKMIDVALNSNS